MTVRKHQLHHIAEHGGRLQYRAELTMFEPMQLYHIHYGERRNANNKYAVWETVHVRSFYQSVGQQS